MMEYCDIINILRESADEKYKAFHQKLKAEGGSFFHGVRVPKLRELAKEIIKDDPISFINNVKFNSYEEKVLYGLVISNMKCDFDELQKYMPQFIDAIDSWAVCDIVGFKVSENDREQMWGFIEKYFNSDKEFHQRFAIVNAIDNFLDEEYIDRVFGIFESIHTDQYYVNMAIAWALQVSFVKQKDRTYELFERGNLSKVVINKAVQKIRESRQVDVVDKEKVLKYKSK